MCCSPSFRWNPAAHWKTLCSPRNLWGFPRTPLVQRLSLIHIFGSIEELCEHEDDIICHSGCDDMADVARYYLEESGQLGELPAHLQNYIDYAAYGRDMELDGTFVITNHGVYEILR